MDFATTAVVTAAIAALVMLVARRLGANAAGLLAGLPYTTVPALAWIGSDRGADVAAQVAIGSVVGCAVTAVFAAAYEQGARRLAPALALLLSLLALATCFCLTRFGDSSLAGAVFWATAASALALALMRRPSSRSVLAPASATPSPAARGPGIVVVASCAGLIGGGIVVLTGSLSPTLAGLFATLPIVGAATVTAEHASRGSASVTRFLRGYVISGFAEAAFSAVFAVSVVAGGLVNALTLALLASAVLCVAADRCLSGRLRSRPAIARPISL